MRQASNKENIHALRQWSPLIAFSVQTMAGLLETAAFYPIDVARTRLQLQTERRRDQMYRGVSRTVRKVLREEGFRRTYRGLSVACGSLPLQMAIRAYCTGHATNVVDDLDDSQRMIGLAATGALCGAAESVLLAPTEVAMIHLQSYVPPGRTSASEFFRGPRDVYKHLWRTGGVSALYRGFSAVLMRQTVLGATLFTSYEYFVRTWVVAPEGPYGFKLLVCGIAAAGTATLASAPFDVIKTRMQRGLPGMQTGLVGMLRTEGVRSLFRGAKARLYRVSFGTVLSLVAYESLIKNLIDPSSLRFEQ